MQNRSRNPTKRWNCKRMNYAKQEINNEAPFYSYTVINKQDELNSAMKKVIKIIKTEGYCLK